MEKYCASHPQKKAFSICHNCGKSYCESCLNEGILFYYCNEGDCYERFKNESKNIHKEPDDIFPSFVSRLTAYLLDSIMLFIINTIILIPFIYFGTQIESRDIILELDPFVIIRHPIFFWVGLIYFTVMESGVRKATYGKRMQELVVVTRTGHRISFLRSLSRNLCRIISVLTVIGYFLPLFVKSRQALHDMICGTLVLKGSALPTDVNLEDVSCQNCHIQVELNLEEIVQRKFECPECSSINHF